jgi:hypothetical protein
MYAKSKIRIVNFLNCTQEKDVGRQRKAGSTQFFDEGLPCGLEEREVLLSPN